MHDFYQQHKEKIAIQEAMFSKLGNILKGGQKKDQPQGDPRFELINGVIYINKKSTIKKTHPILDYLKEYDWDNSPLAFIVDPQTEFHAEGMGFDLQKGEIVRFNGNWLKGEFIGGFFSGDFYGSMFRGAFIGTYENYHSPIKTFYGGTFTDVTNKGLLGLPNTTDLTAEQVFNIITVPVGYTIFMKSATGIQSYIQIVKRLDKVNDHFTFNVLDGFKGMTTPQKIEKDWIEMRSKTSNLEIDPRKSRNIADLIIVPEGDEIMEMRITKSPIASGAQNGQAKNTFAGFEPGKVYKYNLSNIHNLGIHATKGKVFLKFPSTKDYENFNRNMAYANSDNFAYDISNLSKALKFGELTQKDLEKFPYVSYIVKGDNNRGVVAEIEEPKVFFDSPANGGRKPTRLYQGEREKAPVQDPRLKDPDSAYSSAVRINNFIKDLIPNIIDESGKQDEIAQYNLINKMKALFVGQPVVQKPGQVGAKPTEETPVQKLQRMRNVGK